MNAAETLRQVRPRREGRAPILAELIKAPTSPAASKRPTLSVAIGRARKRPCPAVLKLSTTATRRPHYGGIALLKIAPRASRNQGPAAQAGASMDRACGEVGQGLLPRGKGRAPAEVRRGREPLAARPAFYERKILTPRSPFSRRPSRLIR